MMRIPEIEQAAERAKEGGFQSEGKINVYRCQGASTFYPNGQPDGCGMPTVTIDRETGVTPFITECVHCGGQAQSSLYRVPPGLQPTHEWYRPDNFDGLSPNAIEHVRKGGLILRPIEGQMAEAFAAKRDAAIQADDDAKTRAAASGHRMPDWRRFTGDIAMVAMVEGNTPTVGVASDICDECDTRRVLIACISDAGHECNIGVAPEEALKIAKAIELAALKLAEAQGHS